MFGTAAHLVRYVVWPTLERPWLIPQTILIVEDDPIILMSARHALRQAGLQTVEAETADEAVAILASSAQDIVAVFSDIETPGALDGLGLARTIAEKWPTIPVVLTSGRITPSAAKLPTGVRFMGKPYDLERVADLLRDLTQTAPNR